MSLQTQNIDQTLNSQKHTPYLALMGKPWSFCCEEFGWNWLCNNGTALYAGLILGLRPANERWCYFVTMSLIDWAQA